nr:hypothetical protein GCM10020092_090810 [Actinoplanes digitatis]
MTSDSYTRSRLTIVARLVLMATVGVAAVALVMAAAYWGSANQSAAARDMASTSDGMSSQWNADMMHDALRGDVMSAMFALTPQQREAYGVAEVSEHAETLVSKYDAAAEEAPDSLADQYAQVRPAVVAYGEAAKGLVALAGTDHAAAVAKLPEFLESFGALEEQMGAIDDAMLQAVKDAEGAGSDSSRTSDVLILLASLAGAALTAAAAFFTIRAVRRPLRQMLTALRAAADRDLTVEAEVVRGDELGEMARALNAALNSIRTTVAATAARVGDLTAASGDLRGLARRAGHDRGADLDAGAQRGHRRPAGVTLRDRHDDRDRGAVRVQPRDRPADQRRRDHHGRGRRERGLDHDACRHAQRGEPGDRHHRPVDHHHRRADEPAGAQRDHRGGPRR